MAKLTDQQVFDSARDYMLGGHTWGNIKSRGGNGFFDCDGKPCALMHMIGANVTELKPKYHQHIMDAANSFYFHTTGRTLWNALESDIMRIYDQGYNEDTEKQLKAIATEYNLNFESVYGGFWTAEDQLISNLNNLKLKLLESA